MKIVYSQWSLGREPFKEMAACSNHLAQSHGFETILYTDEQGREDLKNIKFTEVRLFPDKINQLPKKVWSLGKLTAMADMNEPFFHIDQDVFLYRNVLKKFLEKDFVCFHDEPTAESYLNLFRIENHFKNICPEILKDGYNIRSHNFAIVGGNAFKELKQTANEILDVCIENKDMFDSFGNEPQDHHKMAVFTEQVWISAMMKKRGIQPSFILGSDIDVNDVSCYIRYLRDQAKQLGVAHFWTASKYRHRDTIVKYAKKLRVSF